MIQRLEISGVHMEVGDDLRKYIAKKIGKLDRFAPKASRESMHTEVRLKEARAKGKKECICEVVMHLPHETLTVKEGTVNMFAAVDIAETRLHHQLKKYKDLHANPRLGRRMLTILKRRPLNDIA